MYACNMLMRVNTLMGNYTRKQIFSKSRWIKQKLYCNITFFRLISHKTESPFGAESIGTV